MTKYGMVIDLKRCIGCDTCTVACRAEHATSRGVLFNRVFKFEVGKYPNSKLGFLPITCMHCGKPECEKQCPTGATVQREDGIVTIDSEKCMGCQYCVVTCPYGTRYFIEEIKAYVKGFETPYGMELLATVHWVANKAPDIAKQPDLVIKEVQEWSPRKKFKMLPQHITKALKRLKQENWLNAA